jgi:hypothetical protein
MSRSDPRQAPPGGYRPQAAPPRGTQAPGDFDYNAWTQGLGGAPLPNPKPAQNPAQNAAAAPAQPQPGFAAQPSGYDDQGYYWGPGQQPGVTTQFDPYIPPTATPAYGTPAPQANGYGMPQSAAYAPAQAPAYGDPNGYQADPRTALRGAQYDQWAAAPAGAPAPASDPRGYDLSAYMPPQGRTQPPQQDFGHLTADLATHPQSGYSDWGHQAGYQPDTRGYAAQTGGDADGYAQQGYADPNAQGYDDENYEAAEPPRSRKWMTVMAALVGAIVVGGGMTYGYLSLFGGAEGGPTPVVKSAEGPSKVKPAEPGGKQFANTDSKLLGRLGEGSSSSANSATESDGTGARKVQTLVVGRDGEIQAPAAAAAAAPEAVPGVSVPVPGMTLIDVPGADTPAPAPVAQKPQPIVVQPPAEPVQVAANETRPAPVVPKSINSAVEAQASAAAEAPAPVAEKPKPAPKPVTKTAAIPESSSTPPAPKTTGLGYVAVLASVPASGTSRIDALQQFADLQQRYGGILQNKTPDVTEANLGEKGRYHRLVVGPPGSKDGANSVCSQLKSAGYSSCWVMAY